jgi:hypothetical protein
LAQHFRRDDAMLVAARDTMRVIEVRLDTVRDTIKVREKVRQHWDTVVRNVSDTQVVIQREASPPDTVTLPVEVIRRDVVKDSLLSAFYDFKRGDSLWHIQDAKLPHQPESAWGIGATCGVDPFNREPRCTVGVTYRWRLPKLKLPLVHAVK